MHPLWTTGAVAILLAFEVTQAEAAQAKKATGIGEVPSRTDMQSRIRTLSFRPRRAVPMLMPVQNLIEHMRAEGPHMYDNALMEIYDLEGRANTHRQRKQASLSSSYAGSPNYIVSTFEDGMARSAKQQLAANQPSKHAQQRTETELLWAPHMNLEDFIMGYVRL